MTTILKILQCSRSLGWQNFGRATRLLLAKFAAPRLNVLLRWNTVLCCHCTILKVDLVISLKVEFRPAEHWRYRGFPFSNYEQGWLEYWYDCPPKVLEVYTDGYKLGNGVGSGICSGKLDLNISLRLPDYCSVFEAEVMAIYRTAQLILVNDAPFTCGSIFSDNQAAIKSL